MYSKNKGITLIPLVITIILLLILSGISIRALGGESGLITRTKIAKEENKKSEYKDYLSIAKTEAIVKKGGVEVTLDEYIEQIKADKIEGIKSIEKITNDKASVITKEGYIFIITVNTIEYYENENTLPEMDIKDANIEFAFDPNTWTNGNVEVTVSKKESKYTLQLSKDAEKWTTTNKMTFEENGEIYARLIDELGRTSDIASRKITKIDKDKPVITELTPSTNSVRIKATDDAAGIIGYAVTTSTTAPTAFTKCDSTKSLDVTVDGLKQGTTYYAWVKDAAGNVSAGKSTATGSVTGLTISGNTSDWSTSKTITIKAGNSNYSQIRYTTDGTIPTSTTGTGYTASFTITSNCTIIAVAFDSTGQVGTAATNKVTTIDIDEPTIGSITGAFTIVSGNTGTIKLTSISDVGSGLSGYHVNTTGTAPTSSSTWTASTVNSISYSVTSAGTYYFWVRDNVGRISTVKSCKVSVATAVAKVGNTYYSSITNAINAISTTGTITVLQNRTEDLTIPAGKTIILNLNGKTLKGTGTLRVQSNKYDSTIINNGTLTIYNGTVTGNDWVIYNTNSSKLTVNSGTYTASQFESICNTGNSTTTIKNGTFTGNNYGLINYGGTTTISGGTFTGKNYDGIRVDKGTTTITNGTFNGKNFGLYTNGGTTNVTNGTFNSNTGFGVNSGTLNISGGKFTGISSGGYGLSGTITITGGTFRGNGYDGISNHGSTIYVNGGNYSGKNWGIYSETGKIYFRRTDSQTSDQGLVSSQGWQAIYATDLTFY